MDELDFGWGFGAMIIGIVSLYAIAKGLLTICFYYVPANWVYRRFLKTEEPTKNFFRFLFCWAVFITLLSVPLQMIHYRIDTLFIGELNGFLRDNHSSLHMRNLFFVPFIFWRFSFDKSIKKIKVLQELTFRKKIVNYLLLFIILFIAGFFLKFEVYYFQRDWLLQNLVFFFILIAFLRIRNLKII